MLHFGEDDHVEPVSAVPRQPCQAVCEGERQASWQAPAKVGGKPMLFCGWCLLYSNMSQWGYDNRDELRYVGGYCKGQAALSQSKRTHHPELDERHRLNPEEAERFCLGIGFTTKLLEHGPLGRFGRVRERAEEMLDGDEGS